MCIVAAHLATLHKLIAVRVARREPFARLLDDVLTIFVSVLGMTMGMVLCKKQWFRCGVNGERVPKQTWYPIFLRAAPKYHSANDSNPAERWKTQLAKLFLQV